MRWTVVRNENGEIIERRLERTSFVIRRKLTCNVLFDGDKELGDTLPGSGETIKSLKKKAEEMALFRKTIYEV